MQKIVYAIWEAWLATIIAPCAIQADCWLLELHNAQFQLEITGGSVIALHNFSGLVVTIPHDCTKKTWGTTTSPKCAFHERKAEPSLSGLRNVVLVRQRLGQGCLDPMMGNWKQQKWWKRHVETNYLWITELDVLKSLGCVVGCQSSKINVKEWPLMHQINNFSLMTCIPQIQEKATLGGKILKWYFHVTSSCQKYLPKSRDSFYMLPFTILGKIKPCM